MSTEINTFKFEATDVVVVTDAKGRWLSLSQLAGQIGLDTEGQRQRVTNTDRSPWSEGMTCNMQVMLPGQPRAYANFMLHERIVPMWIATVESGSVPDPVIKAQVVYWQKHFANVLADYVEGRLKASSQPVSPRRGSRAAILQWVGDGAVEFYDNGMPKRFDPQAPVFAASLLRGMVQQALDDKEDTFMQAVQKVQTVAQGAEAIGTHIHQVLEWARQNGYATPLTPAPGTLLPVNTGPLAPPAGDGTRHAAARPGRGGKGSPNAE